MTARPPLRVLIVDDEPIARSGMRALCGQDPELHVVAECVDGVQAVAAIETLSPDVVLLDVQMPGLDGFGVLRELTVSRLPVLIFVTAFDRFALRAFDVHALDYLLKPFDDARFAAALVRAKAAVRSRRTDEMGRRMQALIDDVAGAGAIPASSGTGESPTPGTGYTKRIVVRERERTLLIRTRDIDWIEAADYNVALHVGGTKHLMRESMASLEARLDPAMFFRAHRSAIVNLDRVREVQPYFGGDLVMLLTTGAAVRLSRGRRGILEARLGQSL